MRHAGFAVSKGLGGARQLAGWRGWPVHTGEQVRGLGDQGLVQRMVPPGGPGGVRIAEYAAAIVSSKNAAATQIR